MPIPVETGSNEVMAGNSTPDVHLGDAFLDLNQSFKYHLGLLLNESGLQAIVYDPKNETFITYSRVNFKNEKTDTQEVNDVFSQHSWLNLSYKTVKVGVVNDYATMVPESVFSAEHIREIFALNFGKKDDWEVASDQMQNSSVRQVFGFPKWIRKSMEARYSDVTFHHSSSPIFDYLFSRQGNTFNTYIHLDVNHPFMSVCALKNGKLLLANTLKYKSLTELVYQVLYAFKKLDVSPEETTLYLSGDVRHADAAFNELYKFVRNVEFLQDESVSKWTEPFSSEDKHTMFNLTRLLRCEL